MRPIPILVTTVLIVAGGPVSSAGPTQQVLMKGVAYTPGQITVHIGDTVEWANQDIVAHTATSKDKSWDVNVLPGRTGRMVMKAAGRFDYICRYHPNMAGQIVVEP